MQVKQKKQVNKILSLLLVVVMVLTILPASATAGGYTETVDCDHQHDKDSGGLTPGDCGKTPTDTVTIDGVTWENASTVDPETSGGSCGANVTWSIDANTFELTISGTGAMANFIQGGAPWYADYRGYIETVVIESGITNIGTYAFSGCTALAGATIPDSVTGIANYAFSGCTTLASVTIGNSVENIGAYAFLGCIDLLDITIPNSVTYIGPSVFSGCNSLANVTLSNYMGAINEKTFENCSSLASVIIPDSVGLIGEYAFSGCSTLVSVAIPDSVWSIGDYAFQSCTGLTSATVGEGVSAIAANTFLGCSDLVDVIIGNKVEYINSAAFQNCTSLTSITIPANVTIIYNYVFNGCSKLKSITFEGTSPPNIGTRVFTGVPSTGTVNYPKGTYLAYKNALTGTGLDVSGWMPLGGSCGRISENGGNDLAWFLKNGVLTISGTGAMRSFGSAGSTPWYDYRAQIVEVVVEDGVPDISDQAFRFFNNLASVTIGKNVTQIGIYALDSSLALSKVTFEGTTPPSFSTGVFWDVPDTGTVICPIGTEEAYRAALDAQRFLRNWTITVPVSVTGVIVSPSMVDVAKGTGQNFTAAVSGTGFYNNNVTWTVSGGRDGTSINSSGRLTVAAAETAETLTVTATANGDGSKSDTAAVTVVVNAETPNLTVQPAGTDYYVGDTAAPLIVTAAVGDGGTLSYQWYRNTTASTTGGTQVGTNATSYTPDILSAGTFYYYVVVTNTNNNASGAKTAAVTSGIITVRVSKKSFTSLSPIIFAKAYLPDSQSYAIDLSTLLPPGVKLDQMTYEFGFIIDNKLYPDTNKVYYGESERIKSPRVEGSTLYVTVKEGVSTGWMEDCVINLKSSYYNNTTGSVFFIGTAKTPVNVSGVTVESRVCNGEPITAAGTPVFTDAVTNETVTGLTPVYTWTSSSPQGTQTLPGAPVDQGSYMLTVTAEGGSLYDVMPLNIRFEITAPDTTPPVLGKSGITTVSNITANSLTLNWTAAADNVTEASNLTYKVHRLPTASSLPGQNEIDLNNPTKNLTSFNVTNLTPNTTYWFYVAVFDEAGNYANYEVVSATTLMTYLVTVNSGTGGGNYAQGATITITANAAPAGQRFKQWNISPSVTFTGGTSATSATAKFAMPAQAVAVTAVYENLAATPPPTPTPSPQIVKVTGVKTLPTLYIVKGKSVTLSAAVQPYNAADKGVTWSSKNKTIAKVDTKTGKVTGVKAGGKTTITATTKDGKKTATCTVYVLSKTTTLKSLSITPSKATGLVVGKTLQVKPKLNPSKATGIVPTYKSSNTKVAVIDKAGVITALKAGKTTITITAGKYKKTFTLNVGTVAASKITLNKKTASVKNGKTVTLSVKAFTPANTNPKTITWTTGNKKIATVSSKGVVKGIRKGKVTITATTWNGKTAKCTVTVK